jgi:hypothetical protein
MVFGRVFDTTGSYAALLQAAGVLAAGSGLLMLGMRPAPDASSF